MVERHLVPQHMDRLRLNSRVMPRQNGGDAGIGERVFHIRNDANVTIEDLTIRSGRDAQGGGLLVVGNNR